MKKTISSIIASVVIIILLFLFFKYNRFEWVKKDQKVVSAALYDSLVAIAEKPPVIVVDTIRDTIYIKTKVDTIYIHKDADTVYIPKAVELDNQGYLIKDTLRTEYFSVFLQDEFNMDHVIRSWSSEVYKENYVTTIEVEKPVIKEVPVGKEAEGLYGGMGYTYIFGNSHFIEADVSLLTAKKRIYSISGGLFYNGVSQEVKPGIGAKLQFKF